MFSAQQKQFTFKTKEQAQLFQTALADFDMDVLRLRKSLPEFKHHANPGWSVFTTALTWTDESSISVLATECGGRKWGKPGELHPTQTRFN